MIALTYYRPHTSGLTIYAERLARGLAARGHPVTVLTSQYEPSLPRLEKLDGVQVVRVPVLCRVSKGVIMPTIGLQATRWTRWADVLSVHLPQFDAAGLAIRGRVMGKPVVLTFHCDLQLPFGVFNRAVNAVVNAANLTAGVFADAIVSYTRDYASHSAYLAHFQDKIRIIPPPVEMDVPAQTNVTAFRARWGVNGQHVIGMATRLAAEKGVEVLLAALPHILERYPDVHVLYAGQHQNVMGEQAYAQRLQPLLERYRERWNFLGVLNPQEMAVFFAACDTLVVPSLNSTESFGLVQVEAMLCGTPSIASNLPGVRVPPQSTGMGRVIPIGDSLALAKAIIEVLDHRERYVRPRAEVEALYSTPRTAEMYEELFEELLNVKRKT
ncbi:MAG: glycosyltransferase family 4 protein [Thermoflexales bacterium]|nr:glycosyltransferase family 4 protein [Thermoflexales bacterium]